MNSEQEVREKSFIEEVGLVFEQLGMPRMAGRIVGWLMLSNPPYQSIDEMAEALMASKGSISTITRFLIQVGLIERIGLPGVRRSYFRIRPDFPQHLLTKRAEGLTLLRQLVERGLELMRDKPTPTRQGLEEMRDMYIFFEREFPALLGRWEQERERNKSKSVAKES